MHVSGLPLEFVFLKEILDKATDQWGVKVERVEMLENCFLITSVF